MLRESKNERYHDKGVEMCNQSNIGQSKDISEGELPIANEMFKPFQRHFFELLNLLCRGFPVINEAAFLKKKKRSFTIGFFQET